MLRLAEILINNAVIYERYRALFANGQRIYKEAFTKKPPAAV